MASVKRVLWVEPDRELQELLASILEELSAEVTFASSLNEALRLVEEAEVQGRPFCLIVSELKLPDGHGMDLLRTVGGINRRVKRVLCTGYPASPSWLEATGSFLDGYWEKPVAVSRFMGELEGLLQAADGEESAADSRRA